MTIEDTLHGAADEFKEKGASARVVVLGSLHLDIMVHAPDRPKKGETLPGSAWGYKAGGKGGNQAVAAAQFGARASMVGRVGDDDFGKSFAVLIQFGAILALDVVVFGWSVRRADLLAHRHASLRPTIRDSLPLPGLSRLVLRLARNPGRGNLRGVRLPGPARLPPRARQRALRPRGAGLAHPRRRSSASGTDRAAPPES